MCAPRAPSIPRVEKESMSGSDAVRDDVRSELWKGVSRPKGWGS